MRSWARRRLAPTSDIPGAEAWHGGEDAIRAAVAAVAVPDTELSARLPYRRARASSAPYQSSVRLSS